MRLMSPIAESDTPCERKYTGRLSTTMPNGKPSAKYRRAIHMSFRRVDTVRAISRMAAAFPQER
jgi:hypothetical protein